MTGRAPLSLLFVVPSLCGGGAEFVARTWMSWLADQGHAVSVVTTAERADETHLPEGVAAYTVAGGTGHLAKARAVRDLFEVTDADIAVSLQSHANLVLIAAGLIARGTRPQIIVSERNLVSLGLPGSGRRHRTKMWLARRLYRRADHIIAISHAVGGELVAGFGVRRERMTVVANPATAKVAGSARAERTPGIREGVQIVLPCRLVDQKRPTLAIDTAVELIGRGIPAEVVSYGDGPLLGDMTVGAARAGVPFVNHGWVEDWFTRLGPNAVVLLPSIREGFGNVLVEAAAVGIPSVAVSGALGVSDAIIPRITGELALTGCPADLADAVIRASGLDLEGIDAWLDRFSVDASGRDLSRVFDLALSRSAGA